MITAVQFLSALVIFELFLFNLFLTMLTLLVFVPVNFCIYYCIVFDNSECFWLLINTVYLFYLKTITFHFPPLDRRTFEVRSLSGLRQYNKLA
jgi:hypothetical protein